MVAANDPMAGDKNADAVGTDGLCHSSCSLCIADARGNVKIGPRFPVWYVEQRPPYAELENGAEGVEGDVERLAVTCEIVVKLPLCLFNDRGRLYPEIRIHALPDPAHVSFGTRHSAPVAQTQFFADRCQDEFSAWGTVILYLYCTLVHIKPFSTL